MTREIFLDSPLIGIMYWGCGAASHGFLVHTFAHALNRPMYLYMNIKLYQGHVVPSHRFAQIVGKYFRNRFQHRKLVFSSYLISRSDVYKIEPSGNKKNQLVQR